MSEENQPDDTVRIRRENIILTDVSIRKINHWFEQINAKKKIRLSRKDFINWFIEKSPDNLSNADLNAVIERFYDEEAFLRQLLREVKRAKKDGHAGNLEVVVRHRKLESKREVALMYDEEEDQSEPNS